MRLLDLFCGAGGAAMGYHRAGFDDIVGIDIAPQPNYPFAFIQADALRPPVDLDAFDLIHASPPCQAYSTLTPDPSQHPDLVAPTRVMLGDRRWIIENVVGSPLDGHLMLCGSMFRMGVQRHRYFEFSRVPLILAPACNHLAWPDGRPWGVFGDPDGFNQGINGGQDRHKYQDDAHGRELMGMPWALTRREVTEAIPPAYTEYIGRAFLEQTV